MLNNVIYGCPESGKTTLIPVLTALGYVVIDTDDQLEAFFKRTYNCKKQLYWDWRKQPCNHMHVRRIETMVKAQLSDVMMDSFVFVTNLHTDDYNKPVVKVARDLSSLQDACKRSGITPDDTGFVEEATAISKHPENYKDYILLKPGEYMLHYLDKIDEAIGVPAIGTKFRKLFLEKASNCITALEANVAKIRTAEDVLKICKDAGL